MELGGSRGGLVPCRYRLKNLNCETPGVSHKSCQVPGLAPGNFFDWLLQSRLKSPRFPDMSDWNPLDPEGARRLSDARRQLHHAAQLATAFGLSYLEKKPDDSHTNLEWIEPDNALASNALGQNRIAVRVPDLTLTIGSNSFALRGNTIEGAGEWARTTLTGSGLDGARYTLKRHYEIPDHPVASGAKFDASDNDLRQLSGWYSNAVSAFEKVRARDPKASEVRCWPHHFDIATLIVPAEGKSVGVGMEPGDTYYDEPYFYVNMYPSPGADELPEPPDGGGMWHTREWIGAVLPASQVRANASEQQSQVDQFLQSAINTAKRIVTRA